MFKGLPTGMNDSKGNMIHCGDRVSLRQYKSSYIEKTAEDGWGRTIRLCAHDRHTVPAKEETIYGVVVYNPDCTGFEVKFENYMMNSGRKEQSLYMLGRTSGSIKEQLLVVGRK